jgi:O-antigen/teichoic acid export membrane protein
MDKVKKLVGNTLIFAIGTIGSKMLQIILLPYYSRVLNEHQYGTVDLLQSASTLLLPIVTLTIADAVFRYAMDQHADNSDVFTIGSGITAIGSLVVLLLALVLQAANASIDYMWTVSFLTITTAFRSVHSQFVRAIGKVKLYTIDNILQTLFILVFNILFLTVFRLGIFGYMLGYVLANLVSAVFLLIAGRLWKYWKVTRIEHQTIKSMLIFSIPLIPNTICWWISNFTDRYMLAYMMDEGATGIFAMSYKIPTLLTVASGIFFQAWQISSNEEYENGDMSSYYSSMFEYLQAFTFILSSALILCAKMIMKLMGADFYSAWESMPTLILAVTFFTFAQLLGTLYTTYKKTVMAFVTNLVTACINIVLNYFLIQQMGILGAAIATAVSYFVFWIYRVIDCRKIVKIHYHVPVLIWNVLLLLIQTVVMTMEVRYWIPISILLFALMILGNRRTIIGLIRKMLGLARSVLRKKEKQNG